MKCKHHGCLLAHQMVATQWLHICCVNVQKVTFCDLCLTLANPCANMYLPKCIYLFSDMQEAVLRYFQIWKKQYRDKLNEVKTPWMLVGAASSKHIKSAYLSIYLSLHRVPKEVGSMNKISPSIPFLSNHISLKEGVASNDIIFPSLPWSSLSVGTSDHFHKNVFGKTHVAHSANMTKPGQLWFSDASKDPLGFKFAEGNSLKWHLHYVSLSLCHSFNGPNFRTIKKYWINKCI